MDLSTSYMGLRLRSPLIPSSCQQLSDTLDSLKKMEDAGAGAVVLYSLFEEQLRYESREFENQIGRNTDSFPEALNFFPELGEFLQGPQEYLHYIGKAKQAVKIPVIASLNGASLGGWNEFSREIEQAGADALELNIYSLPADFSLSSEQIERDTVEILKAVKSNVKIPVAVKLSPFYTHMAQMAKKLSDAGADGLVLFNRFYQPDIDVEALEVKSNVILSGSDAIRLPLRWIAILYGRIPASLAATSGIHGARDVAKMLLAGADVTMVCSVLLRRGISYLEVIQKELTEWMTQHGYESVSQMQGLLSQEKCEDPSAFERAQYLRVLHGLPSSSSKIRKP